MSATCIRSFLSTTPSLLLAASVLSACGSGGGSGDSPANPPPAQQVPNSGNYGWLLKAEGPTDSLKYGLSLVHPATPTVEFVIENASAAVTDAKVVLSGTVDQTQKSVTDVKPASLIYIVGGDVRRVPLKADGKAPKTLVQSAKTTSACSFVSELDVNDYANPDQSRFIVSTTDASGKCNTAGGGRAEVRLSSTAPGISVALLPGAAPVAALRDPASLVAKGWLFPTNALLSNGNSLSVRTSANPISRAVASTYRNSLLESPAGLSVLEFSGTAFVENNVTTSAPTGWQRVGYDVNYYYVYRNSGDDTGTWQVLRISQDAPSASILASGNGQISVASLGKDQIYLTTFVPGNNLLLRLPKAVPGANPQVLETAPNTTLSTVVTSSGDVHQLWRVSGIGTSNVQYTLSMIDEAGGVRYVSNGGGFKMLLVGADKINFKQSENRSVFVFASNYGNRAFSDAMLVSYNTLTGTARDVGKLPGNVEFGNDFVFADVSASPSGLLSGFAARTVNGVVQAGVTKVFFFDASSPGSLKFTTQQQ